MVYARVRWCTRFCPVGESRAVLDWDSQCSKVRRSHYLLGCA
jgi:hypothetical protein